MLNTYSYHGEFFVKRETPTVINLEALPHLELSTSIFSILLWKYGQIRFNNLNTIRSFFNNCNFFSFAYIFFKTFNFLSKNFCFFVLISSTRLSKLKSRNLLTEKCNRPKGKQHYRYLLFWPTFIWRNFFWKEKFSCLPLKCSVKIGTTVWSCVVLPFKM